MRSGFKRAREGRRGARGLAAFRSPAAAVVAAFALLVQLLVVPHHQALSAPLAPAADVSTLAAAAELKAVFGDAAALCVQTDDKGGPASPAGDCDDHCPICHFAAQAASLVAPDLPALPGRLDAPGLTLGVADEARALPPAPASRHRARAPPFAV